jgi:hypothetical protein
MDYQNRHPTARCTTKYKKVKIVRGPEKGNPAKFKKITK